ncbi:MAG: AMIN domain-containing protein [Prochloron sp. SP5CPC1]|nr:AMIN domain-containing protein [Candidatus Paraprochloron terpiosi SP5CPC1]
MPIILASPSLIFISFAGLSAAEVTTSKFVDPDTSGRIIAQNRTPIEVTGVRLNLTGLELEIIFDTLDEATLSMDTNLFRTEGNKLIADIPNAILALPENEVFRADNPTFDIVEVQVTQLNTETIQVTVIGREALPTTDVVLRSGVLAYILNPEGEAVEEELIVTGEGEETPYVARDATTATRTDTPTRDIPQAIQLTLPALKRRGFLLHRAVLLSLLMTLVGISLGNG